MKFSLRHNHAGYVPRASKVFLLACDLTENPIKGMEPWFQVMDESGTVVADGQMSEKGSCKYTDDSDNNDELDKGKTFLCSFHNENLLL